MLKMGGFDIYDAIDGTPFVVRYARCDGDDGDDELDDYDKYEDEACFKNPISQKLQERLKWLNNITLLTREGSVLVPKNVLPEGGHFVVRGAIYDARGNQIARGVLNSAPCLPVHTANWNIMMNTATKYFPKMSHADIFDAMWLAPDRVLSGPQDFWIAKNDIPFLGYVSYRSNFLREPAKNKQKYKTVQKLCGDILRGKNSA